MAGHEKVYERLVRWDEPETIEEVSSDEETWRQLGKWNWRRFIDEY